MSLSELLGSAMSGLAASQAGLRTVSNNIANVGTPGYARERVTLSTSVTSGRVTGVITGEPQRVADQFLEANAYRRASDVGNAEVRSNYLDQLQGLLGAPGSDGGLSARLDAVSASAIAMSSSPSTGQSGAAFVANVQDALQTMQQLDSDTNGLRGDVETEVGTTVKEVNGLLARIHELNATVASLSGTGRSAAGALDQRLTALDDLSKLIKVTIRDQPDGRVNIDTATGTVLLDTRLRLLSYPVGTTTTAQPAYPTIDVRFATPDGMPGAATGITLESGAVGGKLGGLLDLRDQVLPAFSEKLGTLFTSLAGSLNAASNDGTTVPPPAVLSGRASGLIGADRLGFTGTAVFAVTKADGTLVARSSVDFTALGPGATVDDAVAAINAGLGSSATASFSNGRLVIAATATGTGVVVGQDDVRPSDRAGSGFSQYFGLNDLVQSADSTLVPTGFTAADPHGFAAGQTADLLLRNSSGRALASYTLTGSTGPTMGDLVGELNASPLAAYGSFAVDSRGRVAFTSSSGISGAALTIISDSTDRHGSGRSFSALSGLSGDGSGLGRAAVRAPILTSSASLPLARLQGGGTIGGKVLGAADIRGAIGFSDRLGSATDMGKDGLVSAGALASSLIGGAGTSASLASHSLGDANARRDDAVNRRDSYSGVNIDEELAQMVILQNSYSASARVISTASEMYDTLLAMLG